MITSRAHSGRAPRSSFIDLGDFAIEGSRRFLPKRGARLTSLFVHSSTPIKRVSLERLSFDLDLRESSERWSYWSRSLPGQDERKLAATCLANGSTVIDVGANVGIFTAWFSQRVGPEGAVHSFEPNPVAFARLTHHLRLNRITNVHTRPIALGKAPGHGTLRVPTGASGSATLVAESQAARVADEVEVGLTTLDEYDRSEKLERVDLIKIDVEGFEPAVLEGARALIARHRPRLLVEINAQALTDAGSSGEELLALLQELGYRLFRRSTLSGGLREIEAGGRHSALFDVHCLPD